MQIAVSNIAWPFQHRKEAYRILQEYGVSSLEIAPGLLFPEMASSTTLDRKLIRERAEEASAFGLDFVSMQGLFFNQSGMSLFNGSLERKRLRDRLLECADLARGLGISNLVFGAPHQRCLPASLGNNAAIGIAADFFGDISNILAERGVALAIEALPAQTGNLFLPKTENVVEFVTLLSNPNILVNLDLGACLFENSISDVGRMLESQIEIVNHVHLSNIDLKPFTAQQPSTNVFTDELKKLNYRACYSIEMKVQATEFREHLRAALDSIKKMDRFDWDLQN